MARPSTTTRPRSKRALKTMRVQAMEVCDQLAGLSPEQLVYVLGQIAARLNGYQVAHKVHDAADALHAEAVERGTLTRPLEPSRRLTVADARIAA